MIEQIALGIGIFVLILIALFYFVSMTISAIRDWRGIITHIKRIREHRRKNSIGE